MAVYAIGDVQGCCDELEELLQKLNFDLANDQVWLVGDLVNRGPLSLETLRFVRSLGDAAVCVLGNHDLHLLALALTRDPPTTDETLQHLLAAADSADLIEWLRYRPLAFFDAALNTLLVHAGVIREWSVAATLAHAAEAEAILRGPEPEQLLGSMYGNKPNAWRDDLHGSARLRFIVNSLTRMRYCTVTGELDFEATQSPVEHTDGLLPWFRLANRKAAETRIVFGHWSTLGYHSEPGILALDTGCVWGEALTAVRLDADACPVQVTSRQPRLFPGH
jgi:bis(5'-nucleosyl)-tetraphosphatase (symmetrical)